jgi:hypothetical protein
MSQQITLDRRVSRVWGPPIGSKEVNVLCWGLFIAILVIPFSLVLFAQWRSGALGDFAYFYGIGKLTREFGLNNLYNFDLQVKIFHQVAPADHRPWGPSPYPPFVAVFFSLLAGLTFRQAYLVWILISLALYLAGIAGALKSAFPDDSIARSLLLCFALSYSPFLMSTFANGQLSAVAICGIGVGVYLETKRRPFLSGCYLAMLTYKPTLLLFVIPMLIITRRFRALAGFAAVSGFLLMVTTATAGAHIWLDYAGFTANFIRLTGLTGRSAVPAWQYVDLRSQLFWIARNELHLAKFIFGACSLAVAIWIGRIMWKHGNLNSQFQHLLWSAVIACTLIFNAYVPMYDSCLWVISSILTLGSLKRLKWNLQLRGGLIFACCVLAISWVTSYFAAKYGLQPLTIALLAFLSWQLILLEQGLRIHSLESQQ